MGESIETFNQGLLDFISRSPTPFHATAEMARQLSEAGYSELYEVDDWELAPSSRYFVRRNQSSIIAFNTGDDPKFASGIRMVGAHTDSPCLKVKPHPELKGHGCQRLAAEIYGGVLLAPWFDRDLSLAGRVTYRSPDEGALRSTLIDFKKPIATVPSLAIHMDRTANKDRKIDRQKELNMVLALGNDKLSFRELLAEQVEVEAVSAADVLDYEIFAYDTQPPAIIGLEAEFVVSARLDNLLSCYIGLEALLSSEESSAQLLVCSDHEEVGSASACGAQGPFLRDTLERICTGSQHLAQVVANSMMISADNAHAIHPNFPEKHDGNHGPKLNDGPVIKVNASQRYATNSESASLFKHFAALANVDTQSFVTRNDMGCGSTIGPITATEVGVSTIDVGCPQWGMHSIRETAGVKDAFSLTEILRHFYNYDKPLSI